MKIQMTKNLETAQTKERDIITQLTDSRKEKPKEGQEGGGGEG